jgi:SagB-type dehydrogenase family enzyme
VRTPRKKSRRRATATLSARLLSHVTLQAQAGGDIAARFDDVSLGLGKFSAAAAERAKELSAGLPLSAFASSTRETDKEFHILVRRLAGRGLIEYHLGRSPSEDLVVIEPQLPDYWPLVSQLDNADTLVLSRFAYMRRRANEMILESPRAGALFKIGDPKIAAALFALSTPQQIKQLRRQKDFVGHELLGLLVDCQILFRNDPGSDGLRPDEGDDALVLWDFHDLLFHARSTEGRHANPLGGAYPYADTIAPLPAVRPPWPGTKIDLREVSPAPALSPAAKLLRDRHSTRDFDIKRPITLAELARFLDSTARVLSEFKAPVDHGGGDGGPEPSYTARPYPSGGASYELELYLAVDTCEGLSRGFYHYDAAAHALAPIETRGNQLDALLKSAEFAMGVSAAPQILITIAARFGRVSWKYSSLAYALILKEVGALMQTFYVMATDMGLGGCAIGTTNIELFAKMTGLQFHVEGPVGQFALGRGARPEVQS